MAAEESLDWQAEQSVKDGYGMTLTWWTTEEEGSYYLNGRIDIAGAPGQSDYMSRTTHQVRACLEFGEEDSLYEEREQMIFYGYIGYYRFQTLAVYPQPGADLYDADALCITLKTDPNLIDESADLQLSPNYIDTWWDTAGVAFKRPFKAEGRGYTLDLCGGVTYKVYLSHFVAAYTSTNAQYVWGAKGDDGEPVFLEMPVLAPVTCEAETDTHNGVDLSNRFDQCQTDLDCGNEALICLKLLELEAEADLYCFYGPLDCESVDDAGYAITPHEIANLG